jgi:outer membrane protein assembly factor BamA
MGGRSSLRGFQEESLIPEDVCYERGIAPSGCKNRIPVVVSSDKNGNRTISAFPSRGGNYYLLAKAELRLPLTDILSLDLFIDSGNLWMLPPDLDNLALRFGTGLGLSFSTPVGPLSFSVGFNPGWKATNLESPVKYYFSIGQF